MKNKVEMLKVEGVRICLIDGEAYYHFGDLCEYAKKLNAEKEHPRGIPVTSIAKEYGMSGVKLNEYLCGKHIQYKCKGVWHMVKRVMWYLLVPGTRKHICTGRTRERRLSKNFLKKTAIKK